MLKYQKTNFGFFCLSLQILLFCVFFTPSLTEENKTPICLQFQNHPQCECGLKNDDLKIHCPSADVTIILNEEVFIQCKKGDIQSFLKEIPEKMNIGLLNGVTIENCLLGERDSIKNVLNQMGVSGFKIFTFDSHQSIVNKQQFDGLQSVSALHFAIESTEALPSDLFENAPNVQELEFYTNQPQLPKEIFDSFTNLKKLELNGKHQSIEFPDGIFDRLKNLETIVLNQIKILNLSKDIFARITSLTSLMLNANDIKTLPSGLLDNLTNLQSLYLLDNPLNDLPHDLLHKTSRLENIDLTVSRTGTLRTLPSAFLANMQFLFSVDLTGKFEELPEDLFYGSNHISHIQIRKTMIKSLPANLFRDQVALTHLHLHQNLLITLPDDLLRHTIKLRELLLSHNQLTEINDSIFRSLGSLKTLIIDYNKINSISDDAFRMCADLDSLVLANNQLTTISSMTFSSLKSLWFLRLNNNNLSSIASDAFCNTKDLRILNLDHNHLNTDSTRGFLSCLHSQGNLSKLDLSYNEIASITKEDLKFSSSKDLRIILTGNRIERADLPFTDSNSANGPTIILD